MAKTAQERTRESSPATGRPAADKGSYGVLRPATVLIDDETRAGLVRIGWGSVGAGVRILFRRHGDAAIREQLAVERRKVRREAQRRGIKHGERA